MAATQDTLQQARAMHQRGQLEQAEALCRRLLAAQPGLFEASHLLGLLLLRRGQPEQAEAQLLDALRLAPRSAEAHANLGVCRHELRRFEAALSSFEQAIGLQPGNPRLHFMRANTLVELMRCDEALACYDRAITLDPGFAGAQRNRGILKLLTGDYAGGLADYEHRRPKDPARRMVPLSVAPDWGGEALEGRSILVSDATAMGDAIQFCRYLPLLAARGAQVSFLGDARLFRLFASLAPTVRFLPALPDGARFDYQCKLLSLPWLFGTRLDSIPAQTPYLQPEPALSAHWAGRIGSDGFRIGVCWKGNPTRTIDAGRSIPLAGLRDIASLPGVRLISLQKGFGLDELERLPAGMHVETLGDGFDSSSDAFVDSAAVIGQLDLVISSCTSIAHLAGSLRCPTWVALKQVPEWRWGLGRPDNPWYPAMRLFRQVRRDQWDEVFEAMTQALTTELAARQPAAMPAQPGKRPS